MHREHIPSFSFDYAKFYVLCMVMLNRSINFSYMRLGFIEDDCDICLMGFDNHVMNNYIFYYHTMMLNSHIVFQFDFWCTIEKIMTL